MKKNVKCEKEMFLITNNNWEVFYESSGKIEFLTDENNNDMIIETKIKNQSSVKKAKLMIERLEQIKKVFK